MSGSGPQRIARNALARLSGEVVAKATSLVFFVTMARELGREGFGAFMFALGLTGALVLCAGFGTDDLTAREVGRGGARAAGPAPDATWPTSSASRSCRAPRCSPSPSSS